LLLPAGLPRCLDQLDVLLEQLIDELTDLYNAKARAAFVKQAGIELGEAEDVLKHDLGRVLLKRQRGQASSPRTGP